MTSSLIWLSQLNFVHPIRTCLCTVQLFMLLAYAAHLLLVFLNWWNTRYTWWVCFKASLSCTLLLSLSFNFVLILVLWLHVVINFVTGECAKFDSWNWYYMLYLTLYLLLMLKINHELTLYGGVNLQLKWFASCSFLMDKIICDHLLSLWNQFFNTLFWIF